MKLTIACIPKSMEDIARKLGMTETLDPGIDYTTTVCERCETECWIGPMQAAMYAARPDKCEAMCFVCVAKEQGYVQIVNLGNPNDGTIRKLEEQ